MMDDLISRQAAIEAVRGLYIDDPKINNDFAYNMAIDQADSRLKDLPPAQRWVPVTERLPERRQVVIAIGEKGTWDFGMFNGLAFDNQDASKWNWKKNTIKTVKWWMPKESALPEPPKEEP